MTDTAKENILEIIISPDYGAGIWTIGDDGFTVAADLDDDDLPFTAPIKLVKRFNQWVKDYDKTLYKPELFDWEEYDSRGRQLAQEIKNLAGNDMSVTFHPCRETIDTFVGLPVEVMTLPLQKD